MNFIIAKSEMQLECQTILNNIVLLNTAVSCFLRLVGWNELIKLQFCSCEAEDSSSQCEVIIGVFKTFGPLLIDQYVWAALSLFKDICKALSNKPNVYKVWFICY